MRTILIILGLSWLQGCVGYRPSVPYVDYLDVHNAQISPNSIVLRQGDETNLYTVKNNKILIATVPNEIKALTKAPATQDVKYVINKDSHLMNITPYAIVSHIELGTIYKTDKFDCEAGDPVITKQQTCVGLVLGIDQNCLYVLLFN